MIPMIRILDVIHLTREKSFISTRNKACYVISCRVHGAVDFFFGARAQRAERGDVLYIPYGACYTQETEGEELVGFHLEMEGEPPSSIHIYRHEHTDEVVSAFLRAADEWERREQGYQYRCMAHLYYIFSLCGIELSPANTDSKSAWQRTLTQLKAHLYDADLSIGALCVSTNISRTYFRRCFKEHHDCTPMQYVLRKRVQKACNLLRSGSYTNEEIAALCGFSDVKYFYTVFKRYTGKTTGEYRATL